MSKALELAGRVSGRLTAVDRAPNHGKRAAWNCLCACGGRCVVLAENLVSKTANSTSCGCLKRETGITLGHRRRAAAQAKRNQAVAAAVGDTLSRRIGAAVTAERMKGKRHQPAPSLVKPAPTWRHAAAALNDLAKVF